MPEKLADSLTLIMGGGLGTYVLMKVAVWAVKTFPDYFIRTAGARERLVQAVIEGSESTVNGLIKRMDLMEKDIEKLESEVERYKRRAHTAETELKEAKGTIRRLQSVIEGGENCGTTDY